jgi:hypothetical protein
MSSAVPQVSVLGIRHHGPGSARSVLDALDELDPEVVLVEGPPELDPMLAFIRDPALVPPVAGLVYAVAEPWHATFYPMAEFSPEWVALRWAAERGRRARFIDLPAAHQLAEVPEDEASVLPTLGRPAHRPDAIATLATAAGYDDPERWWEDAVEHRSGSALSRFDGIRAAMGAVRSAGQWQSDLDQENERREAAMRREIRSELKATDGTIAVVCGAFHAAAIHPDGFGSASQDRRILTGLPKVKVTATWAPWTAGRLASASGYGAGVRSPGWYQHLFVEGGRAGATSDDVAAGWLVRVSQALREEGLDASPASTVEATRLAQALSAVRGRPSVGLTELTDAAQSVLCDGSDLPLLLVDRTLVVGEALGTVPESVPMVPLAADLARRQKTLRLVPSATSTTVQLDLRKDMHRERSLLFHRLLLIDVPWAQPAELTSRSTGTFKESWQLEWAPELTVKVIEAGLRGTTVPAAAEGTVVERARAATDLAALAALVEQCLTCDLPEALRSVLSSLEQQTAHQHDPLALLGTIEPLARTRRYGNVRQVDTGGVSAVLSTIVTRVSVALRASCLNLDDEAAEQMRRAVESADRGVRLVEEPELAEVWRRGLLDLAGEERAHATVSGRVHRLLLDSGALDRDTVALRMSRRLSVAASAQAGAAWLDGFLDGDALLLLHDHALLGLVDAWVAGVDDSTFDDLLPLLRRSFSGYTSAERQQIAHRLRTPTRTGNLRENGVDPDLGIPAALAMGRLLGLEVSA